MIKREARYPRRDDAPRHVGREGSAKICEVAAGLGGERPRASRLKEARPPGVVEHRSRKVDEDAAATTGSSATIEPRSR